MANQSLKPQASTVTAPAFLSAVPSPVLAYATRFAEQSWRSRLRTLAQPRALVSIFLASSALYCFAIGRDRYTAVSEFVIQQAVPLNTSSSSVLGGAAAAPQVLTSLVDGQYLQVYLGSADVKNRLYPEASTLETLYRPSLPDLISGLPAGSSQPSQLAFYRKQLSVAPQPMSGSVIVKTSGFTPNQALELNLSLIHI